VQAAAPTRDVSPAGHAAQLLEPGLAEKRPGSHALHVVAPSVELKVPAGQSKQGADPLELNCPG
jgi:hypothetical protein